MFFFKITERTHQRQARRARELRRSSSPTGLSNKQVTRPTRPPIGPATNAASNGSNRGRSLAGFLYIFISRKVVSLSIFRFEIDANLYTDGSACACRCFSHEVLWLNDRWHLPIGYRDGWVASFILTSTLKYVSSQIFGAFEKPIAPWCSLQLMQWNKIQYEYFYLIFKIQ